MARYKRKKNKVTIKNELINELNDYIFNLKKNLAIKCREELTEETKNAIEEFYNDYDPVYYNRNFYNFRENSYKKYYSNPHNSIIRGGVELTPNNLDDIYQDNKNEVFDLFYHGYHGVASGFNNPKSFSTIPPVMNPSPLDLILNKRNEIVNNIEKYYISAKSNITERYSYFSFK